MHIMVEDRDTDNTYYSGFHGRGHSSPTCYSPMELKIDTWISLSCYMDLSKPIWLIWEATSTIGAPLLFAAFDIDGNIIIDGNI